MSERRIEYVRIDDVAPATRNPKRHAPAALKTSIDRFGFVAPILRDERTGNLVAGHGRLGVLQAMHDEGAAPPAGVRLADDGTWLVPIICGWESNSDAEAEAYLVADNRHSELGGWDNDELAALLADVYAYDPDLLDATGWDLADLEDLLDDDDAGGGLTDPDDAPPPPADPKTRPGDVWLLGKHRVRCGDSTDVAGVEAMFAGETADCMWTDPPYGVSYVGKTKDALTIENDQGSGGLPELLAGAWATATAVLRPGAPWYIAHPDSYRGIFEGSVLAAGWLFRQNLVWAKNVMVLGRSDYHYQHEPILYGFTDGGSGRLGRGGERWYGDNAQTTVFNIDKPSRNAEHPTMKPIELITSMLANSVSRGGLVYDPFGGSGSTLIAAHQLGMRAYLVELDAKYVDVIARRWQEFSGQLPVLEATGEAVDFTN